MLITEKKYRMYNEKGIQFQVNMGVVHLQVLSVNINIYA